MNSQRNEETRTMTNYKDDWMELDDIRHEIQSLEQRLHMDETDHLRYYGVSNADSEAMDNEIMALKHRLGNLFDKYGLYTQPRHERPLPWEGLLKLNEVVDNLRVKYGLC